MHLIFYEVNVVNRLVKSVSNYEFHCIICFYVMLFFIPVNFSMTLREYIY